MATFFATTGQSSDAALEVCAGCPAKLECGDYAMADPDLDGWWAGTSSRQRAALRREAS